MYTILVKSTRGQSNSFGFAIYSSRIGLWTVLEKNLTKEDADKKLVELRSNPELHCCSGVEWKAVETSSLDLCPECNGTGYHSGCKKCNRTGLHNNHHRYNQNKGETMSFNNTSKTFIKVFWTKTNCFRASISEPGKEMYEVSIGGKSWNDGKGQEHRQAILEKINMLAQKVEAERNFQLMSLNTPWLNRVA